MSRVLFENAIVVLRLEDGYIRYTRTTTPYASLEEVRTIHRRIAEVATPLANETTGFLFDVRAAPSRNDDGFEEEILPILTELTSHFKRHATLVRSMVGRLQVQRMARKRGDRGSPVFSDEQAAIDYVSGTAPLPK